MPFVVMEIQTTPNPNAAKFVLDKPVADAPLSYFDSKAASGHPLATALFEVPGVSSLLLLGDFITVNKRPEARWDSIQNRVREILKRAE
jgi:hypothetical protein